MMLILTFVKKNNKNPVGTVTFFFSAESMYNVNN